MRQRCFRPARRALLALMAASTAPALHAQAPTRYYWYDGRQRRELWLDGSQRADFTVPSSKASAVLKSGAPTAKDAGAPVSPVFRDAPDGAAARALPGGVIVRLKDPLPEVQARRYLEQRGLVVVRQLGEDSPRWLVESPAGTASLDLANRLHESGDFDWASPNWWRARALK